MNIKAFFSKIMKYDICTVDEFNQKVDAIKEKTDKMYIYLKTNIDVDKNGFVNLNECKAIVTYYFKLCKTILKGIL